MVYFRKSIHVPVLEIYRSIACVYSSKLYTQAMLFTEWQYGMQQRNINKANAWKQITSFYFPVPWCLWCFSDRLVPWYFLSQKELMGIIILYHVRWLKGYSVIIATSFYDMNQKIYKTKKWFPKFQLIAILHFQVIICAFHFSIDYCVENCCHFILQNYCSLGLIPLGKCAS